MNEPYPERKHRLRGGLIDDLRADQTQLMAAVHERRATRCEDIAAPIAVGAVDEADDETVAGRLGEHRRAVLATGPSAEVMHDGDRQRSGDAQHDGIEDPAIDERHEAPAATTRAPGEDVRGERREDHGERAG